VVFSLRFLPIPVVLDVPSGVPIWPDGREPGFQVQKEQVVAPRLGVAAGKYVWVM
jgi:hypothetical protein